MYWGYANFPYKGSAKTIKTGINILIDLKAKTVTIFAFQKRMCLIKFLFGKIR